MRDIFEPIRPNAAKAVFSLEILRIVLALLILIHGVFRATMSGVPPFGVWLESQGFPFGIGWAWLVTIIELAGPLLLLSRRLVAPVALLHAFILSIGMVLVHLPFGWFVVGAGRNGMEYSVLLIAGLLLVAWSYSGKQKVAANDGVETG